MDSLCQLMHLRWHVEALAGHRFASRRGRCAEAGDSNPEAHKSRATLTQHPSWSKPVRERVSVDWIAARRCGTLRCTGDNGTGRVVSDETTRNVIALTPRQWEVLRLLLQGVRVPVISAKLGVSRSTVRNHLATIFRKCGVHSQSELIEFLRDRAPINVEFNGNREVVR